MTETKTMRLYYFTSAKFGIAAVCDRRLKISFADKVNDIFELCPFDFGNNKVGGKNRRKWGEKIKAYPQQNGFISLSTTWQDPTMWGHYADNHKGICLGFDVAQSAVEEINYIEDRQLNQKHYTDKIQSENDFTVENVKRYRNHKSFHWRYENEWRYWIGPNDLPPEGDNGLRFQPFNDELTLKEVIFGAKFKENIEGIKRDVSSDKPERLKDFAEIIKDDKLALKTTRAAFRSFEIVEQKLKSKQITLENFP